MRYEERRRPTVAKWFPAPLANTAVFSPLSQRISLAAPPRPAIARSQDSTFTRSPISPSPAAPGCLYELAVGDEERNRFGEKGHASDDVRLAQRRAGRRHDLQELPVIDGSIMEGVKAQIAFPTRQVVFPRAHFQWHGSTPFDPSTRSQERSIEPEGQARKACRNGFVSR